MIDEKIIIVVVVSLKNQLYIHITYVFIENEYEVNVHAECMLNIVHIYLRISVCIEIPLVEYSHIHTYIHSGR